MRLPKHKILDINFIRAQSKIDEEKHKAELLGLKLAEKEQKKKAQEKKQKKEQKEIKSEKFWKNFHQDMKASSWDNTDTKGKLKNLFWTSIGVLFIFWLLSLMGIGP
jgi:hypothetical protein